MIGIPENPLVLYKLVTDGATWPHVESRCSVTQRHGAAPRRVPCHASFLPPSTVEGEGLDQTNLSDHPEECGDLSPGARVLHSSQQEVWTARLLASGVSVSSFKTWPSF